MIAFWARATIGVCLTPLILLSVLAVPALCAVGTERLTGRQSFAEVVFAVLLVAGAGASVVLLDALWKWVFA